MREGWEDEDDESDKIATTTDSLYRTPGLVRDYAHFIYRRAVKFSKRYPWLPFNEILAEAERLARIAERRFEPERGYDFATFCGSWLKGLSRFAKRHPNNTSRKNRNEFPGAVHRIDPTVRKMLSLNRADAGFVRTVIEYQQLEHKPRHYDVGVLHQVADSRANRFGLIVIEAVEAELFCKGDNEAIVLDWMLGRLTGTDERNLTQIAQENGLTKGAVSKIQSRIADRLELQCDRDAIGKWKLKG
jgi:DNA-directed RNA polymerase specialized sigma subunit